MRGLWLELIFIAFFSTVLAFIMMPFIQGVAPDFAWLVYGAIIVLILTALIGGYTRSNKWDRRYDY